MNDRYEIAESIFQAAVDLPSEEHSAFLDQKCGNDSELRALVERLLGHDEDGMSEFLSPVTKVQKLTIATAETPSQIGSYEVLRKIGEGGMAVVYEARQRKPRRAVALKVIKGALFDRSLVKRFDLETSILAKLSHSGIARVYDAGETEDGIPFFAMEYVPGLRLNEYADERELDLADRLELMARVCDAVHYAHEVGIIHRDLKPANILVMDETGGGFQPKVLDFGVARAVDAGLQTVSMHTSTGQLIGTLAYMSPEQIVARSDDLDARSDVYQLGIILYELLAGKRPYEISGLSVPEAGRVILEKEPPMLRTVDTRYRGDVEAIVSKSLYKEKELRYPTAAAMADDIRCYLRNEPIAARPASRLYQLRKLAKRRRDAFVGLGIGLVVAIAVLVALQMQRLRGQEVPTASAETQLTALPPEIRILDGSISPDGETFAYMETRGIFLQDIATKETVSVPLGDGLAPFRDLDWHPTEEKLLAHLIRGDDRSWWYVHPDGRRTDPLADIDREELGCDPVMIRISPDGRKRLLVCAEKMSWSGEEGVPTEILPIGNGSFASPVWSPTGERIAFVSEDALSVTDLEGNTRVLVGPDGEGDGRPVWGGGRGLSWLPDGRLFFTRFTEHLNSELWAIPVDPSTGAPRGDPERIIGWAGYMVASPTVSADGQRLTLLKKRAQDEIFLASLDGNGSLEAMPRRFTLDERINRTPIWSRDGSSIYFESTRFGRADVLYKTISGPTPQRLPTGPDGAWPLCLSSDGEYMLVSNRPSDALRSEDQVAIRKVPLSGGPGEVVLIRNGFPEVQCGESPGSPCVLMQFIDHVARFYMLDATWQVTTEIGRKKISSLIGIGGIDWDLSPDGQEIVLMQSNGSLDRLDLKTGVWKEHITVPGGPETISYAADGQSFFTSRTWREPSIVRISLEGEEELIWTAKLPVVRLWSPQVSPDGTRLAFESRLVDDHAWMLEGF